MSELPEPLTPHDCDLRDFPFMPLDVSRLRRSKSWLYAKRDPTIGFYQMNLWTASWHEVPAASLEDDDDVLADLAMCDPNHWPTIREKVLRGWVKCSDGRLYHHVVAERARSAWASRLALLGRVNRRLEMISGEWAAIRSAIFARDDFTCRYCGARGGRLECDHVIPVSKGGASTPDNLVTACFDCNRSKGAKQLQQWSSCRG